MSVFILNCSSASKSVILALCLSMYNFPVATLNLAYPVLLIQPPLSVARNVAKSCQDAVTFVNHFATNANADAKLVSFRW